MKEFRLVAFGDSLTYGYGVLSHIAYPFRLARELPEKNPQLRWEGIQSRHQRRNHQRSERTAGKSGALVKAASYCNSAGFQ